MEALHAAGLTPVSVLSEKRSEPRKFIGLPAISPFKISNSDTFSRTLHGGLVLLSSVVSGSAKALTYEEALQQSPTNSASDFDANGIVDNVINFAAENPVVVAGGAVILSLTLILSRVLQKPKPWGVESAKKAYAVLSEDINAQLLDIRAAADLRKVGNPDIRGLKKKQVAISYKGEDKPGFLKKLSLKFKEPENTTLFILDKFDGNSGSVAELISVNGFNAAYVIEDGAEGPRGWVNSGLPWIQPSKGLSLDLSRLTDGISEALGDGADGLGLTAGIAAAAGLSALAFSEMETILQVLGLAAIVQFASKKLLLPEDRKQTLQQVVEILNTKVSPKELVDEIKEIGKAFLPETVTPVEAKVEAAAADSTVQKASAEAAVEPAGKVNSVKAESVSEFSRPLSPYPYYPDLKPPSSPSPSLP